ncbi:MAG TPA: glutamate--cysteine ligase [bacterium]|nr:glutamate--cysteine ligase [bacterium]
MTSVIQDLSERIADRARPLQDWLGRRLSALPDAEPPVYASIDVRNAGFKVSVVDTNLFPAGFNNLCETFSERGAAAFKSFFQAWHPSVRKVLIFPEEHTRNLFYWKSVAALRAMLTDAKQGPGLEVEIGSASTRFTSDPFPIVWEEGRTIEVRKVRMQDGFLKTDRFIPDLILINNDLSGGTPEYLKDLKQLLLPSPYLGWHRRRKSEHFHHFAVLAAEAAEILGIDPWLITPLSEAETGVDLSDGICLKRLKDTADRLLDRVREKYRRHGVARAPYLFVKNNAGTYGMGVTHIDSGDAFLNLNRRIRNKLESSKGGSKVSEYLLQEGIPTADFYRGKPIEPVVYLVGGENVGTFFRIHEEKNELENLNAPGMAFACLCFHKVKPSANGKTYQLTYENRDQLFTVACLLGRLASLASVLERHDTALIPARSA